MAYPLQPRPAPGRPSADRLQGGEDWTPIRGQHSAPIDNILNNCLIVPHSIADSHAALGRVQQARPPATRAKQSVKDCLIIEGVLRYVISERAVGRAQRIVFASSNTSDYHQGHGSLHPALRAEFDACDLGFAPSWSAARYEIDRL
ncbi:hypothetical protein Arad_12500 (plasmid) [Rhizobium rhizogenes K84]|uniref:Uncharacterized protein n=1 Tax=Rhizobium rhizogenes (strain K84 / ATCC BAA-868) TaxID=311403 RepID=B9JQN2_RHIR8|nr:hypothetical protein Arad_12500 [Rhizobium rhizogenes K84]